MKKFLVFLIFVGFTFGVYKFVIMKEDALPTYEYYDDFDSLNREFWYVGEWKSFYSAYDKVKLLNGVVKLEIDEVDKGPILLSKPIEIQNGNILKVKRRVKMKYATDHFTGGMAIIETKDEGLIPSALNENTTSLGNGIVLIEYVYTPGEFTKRPGNNVIRILPRSWTEDDNYQLSEPLFNQWFEEEIIYDTANERITYKVNDKIYSVKSQKMEDERVRLYMHGYGFDIGHTVEIDWIDIKIE